MAGFTNQEWQLIDRKLAQNPERFGCPIRRDDSVVIGSFNALKLGKDQDDAKRWEFLTRFVSRFDLLALQEVTDDLAGIRRLHQSLGQGFSLVVTDTTGATPGSGGLKERLAYLYRPARIELKELVSDITFDRTAVVSRLQQDIDVWRQFFADIKTKNDQRQQAGKRKLGLSEFTQPKFLTFIRTPQCASFSIKAKNAGVPIDFLAINAHTLFGKSKTERTREFFALLEWLVRRAKQSDKMYYKNMIVLADLNMEFDDATNRFSDIVKLLLDLESNLLSGQSAARVNFPFLDVHPDSQSLFSTNSRKNQTFDHIAFFIDKNEVGLPLGTDNQNAGKNGPNGYDFGVFDYSELFAQSLHGKPFFQLTKTQIATQFKNTKADVSDHMPIWVRIPVPGA